MAAEHPAGKDNPSKPSARQTDDDVQRLRITLTESQEQALLRQLAGQDESRDWLLDRVADVERLRAAAADAWRTRSAAGEQPLSLSLLRGLGVLNALQPAGTERGISDLAKALKLSPSTTHRYVTTLEEIGLVERTGRNRKYRLPIDRRPPA
jgi:DNA-binding transcriptional ArsR family regulator